MLSRPRKPPEKRCRPSTSLRLTHQVKLSSSFWKTRARNWRSRWPALAGHLVDAPCRPRVHRRIHVRQLPLVRGQLTVRVHVPLAQEQHELLLGEVGIEPRERNHVKRQVPRRVPRVLPLVGHRDHVAVVEMRPVVVAAACAFGRRRRVSGIAFEPVLHDVVIELLRPEQAGRRLPNHVACVAGDVRRDRGLVELVGLGAALLQLLFERLAEPVIRQTRTDSPLSARRRRHTDVPPAGTSST